MKLTSVAIMCLILAIATRHVEAQTYGTTPQIIHPSMTDVYMCPEHSGQAPVPFETQYNVTVSNCYTVLDLALTLSTTDTRSGNDTLVLTLADSWSTSPNSNGYWEQGDLQWADPDAQMQIGAHDVVATTSYKVTNLGNPPPTHTFTSSDVGYSVIPYEG